ncbi:MAG: FtsH protease activity modulator HflK [Pikeienuella sp.]|uniref:FtsH protease activity modulator HflK n=1 Tax=Pikeienuella sp. TaxID=2831957 RepID=UPI00391AB1B5
MSSNGGGPWGGGGGDGGGKSPWGGGGGGGRGPGRGGGQRPPDIEEILKEGRDRLKVIMGGGGGGRGPRGTGGGGQGLGKGGIALIVLAAVGFYLWNALYTVRPEERSVVLTFGERSGIGEPGLNFILWPIQSREIIPVTRENTVDIGSGPSGAQRASRASDEGLMLTGDANIIDIGFQLVWNIRDPQQYLFNLANPEQTVAAVAESAMREVIGRSEMKPILNRDRAIVSQEVQELIQTTLDSYESGINVVRVNFDKADPPQEVIDAFRDVQAAEQERDTLEKRADAYANERLAGARGEAAQQIQEAEGYRARVVNEAEGEASRFKAVFEEYAKAPEVTRKRLFLETMERVYGGIDKIIIDQQIGDSGQGVVPYLPLNELRRTN